MGVLKRSGGIFGLLDLYSGLSEIRLGSPGDRILDRVFPKGAGVSISMGSYDLT